MSLQKLENELKNRFEHWEYLYKYGGQDPFWEDGGNMNLVRNHIANYKRQIKRLCEEKNLELPEIYFKEKPPEMDNNYMARVDEIRGNARRALAEYKASKDYQYLVNVYNKLNKRQIKETCINNVINYCKGLENFIEIGDLVAMRRHEKWERYLESFYDCRKRVEDVIKEKEKPGEQISLMDLV